MAEFKIRSGSGGVPADPEQLYRLLAATNDGPEALWAHQADVLRAWHGGKLIDKGDVAIELPTGSGKTLVGALVAEFLRRRDRKPVAYLCPNNLLARQTATKLSEYGVPNVLLIDKVRQWNPADRVRYDRAAAVAVSVYSHVFNSNPGLDNAQLLLLDDAHAAEGYVAGPWKVEITRSKHPSAYQDLLSVLGDALNPLVLGRLRDASPDDYGDRNVYLASPLGIAANALQIEQVLAAVVAGEKVSTGAQHAWKYVRDHVDRCLVYVSTQQLLIRPLIAPTLEHHAFDAPARRVYMSATLGSGGELERAFGRHAIARIPVPKGWENQGTGRRFFAFPELTSDLSADPDEVDAFVSGVIAKAGRALVLTPDENTAKTFIENRKPARHTVLRADDVKDDLTPFTSATSAMLVLANRYDGIDLPGKECRLVVLDGLPTGSDLQERFLHHSLGAVTVLQERIRARIMQGSGRATRNARDYATVLILRNDLTSYLAKPDVLDAMHPEVHAEVDFGLRNSMEDGTTSVDLLELLRKFNVHGREWAAADATIVEDRDGYQRVMPPGTGDLQSTVKHEVAAWEAIWAGDWDWALNEIRQVLDLLTTSGTAKRYAALWNYLGFTTARRVAEQTGDRTLFDTANGFYQAARRAARGTLWLAKMATQFEQDVALPQPSLDPLDEAAMNAVLTRHDVATLQFPTKVTAARTGLQATDDHLPFEAALVMLGTLAGAGDSYGDDGAEAKPDAVWVFGDVQWVIWEAKNRATDTGSIGPGDVRQAGSHLRTVEADREATAPGDAVCLLVSRKPSVLASARNLAEEHVYLVRPDEILDLFDRIVRAWQKLRSRGLSSLDVAAAAEIFRSEGALPTQWLPTLRECQLGSFQE